MVAFLFTEWRHVTAFVSIFWLASAEADQSIELKTSPNMTVQLGQNVTLTCEPNLEPSVIKHLSWFSFSRNKIVCQNDNDIAVPENICERINGTLLILKLINVSQDDQGLYMCKLRSMKGGSHKNLTVTVQGYSTSSPPVSYNTVSNGQLQANTIQKGNSGFGKLRSEDSRSGKSVAGNLVQSTCIMVGIIIVNLIMYC